MQHIIPKGKSGPCLVDVTPETAGWKYLSFCLMHYAKEQESSGNTQGNEVCLVFLTGDATVEAGGERWLIEGRQSVFKGMAYSVYLPPDTAYAITPHTEVELAFGRAPAEGKLKPRLIRPEDVKVEIRGGHNVTRQISHILDPEDAEHLLCVEVYTPSGNWSSYPPHRHDVQNPPAEVDLDEIYHYRLDSPDGWAIQRLYNDDRTLDELLRTQDGDTVLVREGYHPVVSAPGYDCYYLNFLAGETPLWVVHDDPQLEWVKGNWEGQENRLTLPLKGTGR